MSEIKIKPAYSGGIIKFGITSGLRKNRPYSFLQGKYVPVKVRKRGVYGVRRGKTPVSEEPSVLCGFSRKLYARFKKNFP